ncbi:MAG: DUF188 domain-containing protein [Coriobacteriales bacterium]|jgi:uncharacterized protein YaiI (UPF0178 family)
MTRVFVDMRTSRGCWAVAHAAGLFDLDVVALVVKESKVRETLMQMRLAHKRSSVTSKMSVMTIPRHSADALRVVRALMRSGDVIVTDSALLAFEFLQEEGAATNSFGEKYTWQNIFEKIGCHYKSRMLQSRGVKPPRPRAHQAADRERLFQTMRGLLVETCGDTLGDKPWILPSEPPRSELTWLLPISAFEKSSDAKVFVDGDSCPRLPAILEICGGAHVPVVYVSNRKVKDLVRTACRKESDFISRAPNLPEMTVKKVPKEKNAADHFIERNIVSGDIVLTNDNELMAKCLNKGALAIDFEGRAFGLCQMGMQVEKKSVKRMKAALRRPLEKMGPVSMFRTSLLKAVG